MSLTNREAFQRLITTQNEEVDEKDSSVFQNENSFRFKVMSSPAPYSGPATAIQDPEELSKNGIDSKYLFTGRILSPGMAHEKFLEDPCNESVSPDPGAGSRLYALHTKIRLSQAGAMPQFQPGDIIESEMFAGDLTNLYDLQFCDMTNIADVFQNQQISKAGACAKLGNLFGGGGGAAGSVAQVSGIPLTASDKLTQTTAEPPLITVLRNKGYIVYKDGVINTIGVRSQNNVADSFDDIMHLIWFKDELRRTPGQKFCWVKKSTTNSTLDMPRAKVLPSLKKDNMLMLTNLGRTPAIQHCSSQEKSQFIATPTLTMYWTGKAQPAKIPGDSALIFTNLAITVSRLAPILPAVKFSRSQLILRKQWVSGHPLAKSVSPIPFFDGRT